MLGWGITGSLAGYNCGRYISGKSMLTLPNELSLGKLLSFAQDALKETGCLKRRFTFAGGEFFELMKENNLYTTDSKVIRKKVEKAGLLNVYNN